MADKATTKLRELIKTNSENFSLKLGWKYINYLDTGNITANTINNIRHIDTGREKIPSRAKRLVKFNSIIYSTVRPNKKHYGIIKEQPKNFVVSTGFVVIDVDPDKADADFIYFFLTQASTINRLQAIAQQSVSSYPSISPEDIENLEIVLPPIEIQRKIATSLSAIDNKIKNNNKIIAQLESLTKIIYKYWFLQFEFPNEEGKPYKSSGGKMVWNDKLEQRIPKGWEISDLSPYINIIRGVTYSPKDIIDMPTEGYIPLVKSNNLQHGRLILDDLIYVNSKKVADNQYLSKNSVFVTMSSGSTEHAGKTAIIYYDMPFCYGAFCSKIEIKEEYRCFLSIFFISEYFKKKIHTIIVGTSIKNIENNHLTDNIIAIPPSNILRRFECICSRIFDLQGEVSKENQELITLRDFLLPLLMNGQVRFKDE